MVVSEDNQDHKSPDENQLQMKLTSDHRPKHDEKKVIAFVLRKGATYKKIVTLKMKTDTIDDRELIRKILAEMKKTNSIRSLETESRDSNSSFQDTRTAIDNGIDVTDDSNIYSSGYNRCGHICTEDTKQSLSLKTLAACHQSVCSPCENRMRDSPEQPLKCFDDATVHNTFEPKPITTCNHMTIPSNMKTCQNQSTTMASDDEHMVFSSSGMDLSELYKDALLKAAHFRDTYNDADGIVIDSLTDATFMLSDFFCEQALSPDL